MPTRGRSAAAPKAWSRERVIGELVQLDRSGESTGWAALMQGRSDLVAAAAAHADGLVRARAAAGVAAPPRRPPTPQWSHARIIEAIGELAAKRQSLASSRAPQALVAAARWHYGSWEAALGAAGVDAQAVRLRRAAFTKPEVIALIQRMAKAGQPVRPSTLRSLVKLDAVRALFGSVPEAIRAAGIAESLHGNQRWTRERVLAELARLDGRGESLSPALRQALRQHFKGVAAARAAAKLPARLRPTWTQQTLLVELRRRAGRGDSGRALWNVCKRLFGSVAAARRAARVPASQRSAGMAAWSQPKLLTELRRRIRLRLQLSRGLTAGLKLQFGSLAAARAAASSGRGRAAVGRRVEKRVGSGRASKASASKRRAAVPTNEATASMDGTIGSTQVATAPTRMSTASTHEVAVPTRKAASTRKADPQQRAKLIEKLLAWSTAGTSVPRSLQLACEQQFGSFDQALAAAGITGIRWTRQRILRALREPGFVAIPAFVNACIEQFGSVTAARAAARQPRRTWTKNAVIAELVARSRRGLGGTGQLLRAPAVRLFGSVEAALQAAAQAR